VPNVFISYARENREDVDQLVQHLAFAGYQTWLDAALHGGQNWWQEILRRVKLCDAFLAIISEETLNSVACRREFDWAEALGKPVIPIQVQPVETELPTRITALQIRDYSDAGARALTALRLAGDLAALPTAPPLPDPMPEAPPAPMSYLAGLVDEISGQTFIERDRQHQIVSELEPALRSRDAEERRRGRALLETFRASTYLFADVRDRIDWLMQQSKALGGVATEETTPDDGPKEGEDRSQTGQQPLVGTTGGPSAKSTTGLPGLNDPAQETAPPANNAAVISGGNANSPGATGSLRDASVKPAPGWYPDPSGTPGLRYFNGHDWTDHHSQTSNQQPPRSVPPQPTPRPQPHLSGPQPRPTGPQPQSRSPQPQSRSPQQQSTGPQQQSTGPQPLLSRPQPPILGGQGSAPNQMAVWSLISSLLGVLCIIGGPVGIVLGFVAINQIARSGQKGRGAAIAGILVGFITFLICLVWYIATFSHQSSS
jgi:hypothetical protein